MALIPLNIPLTTEWKDITDAIFTVFEDKHGIEFYLPYEHTKTLEILVDTSGTAVIDENHNFTGTKLDRYFINTSTRLNSTYKYYARALETVATISIKDKGNAVSIEGVDTFHGALNIHDADVHNVPFNEHFHEHTDITTTLDVASNAQATTIEVVDTTGFLVGDSFQISNGGIETTFPAITAINANVFTLDRRLDNDFAIGSTVEKTIINMAVLSTFASPRSFRVIPDGNQAWHLLSFTITMEHTKAADDGHFGDIINGLTNGVLFRAYNGTTGKYRTFTDWKINGDIAQDTGFIEYHTKAAQGNFGTISRASIRILTGAVPKLYGEKGDFIEVLLQDDLSSLVLFTMKAQGHVENL